MKAFANIPLIFSIFFIFLTNYPQEEKLGTSWHFDTKILRKPKLARSKLLKEGFKEISFKSTNDITIAGLLLKRKDAKCTIVFSHGFCHEKEMFSPFVKLAPTYCNLLFIDSRSRGQSEGPNFFSKSFHYGKTDYQDTLNAIKIVNEKIPNTPIIVFGWCSGAFKSATAVLHLKDEFEKRNIKGLVFDSGFGSVMEVLHIPVLHMNEKFVPGFILKLYNGDRAKARQSYLRALSVVCIKYSFCLMRFFAKPFFVKREPTTNLYDKMHNLNIPVLVIHAKDDSYTSWENMVKLIENIPQKQVWLIEEGKSLHARNHLKMKEEYKQIMQAWIEQVLF